MAYTPTYTPPARSAAECLWLWPTVVYRAAPGQDQDFALRIEQQALRKDWQPTTMQLDLMRRMVTHYCPDGIRFDPELINAAASLNAREEIAISPCERCNADGASLHMASGRMLCGTCSSGNRGHM